MKEVDEFIEYYNKIPDELWTVEEMFNGDKYCAAGFLVERDKDTESYDILSDMFIRLFDYSLEEVNDNEYGLFGKPTPKERVLSALQEIKHLKYLQEEEKKQHD